MAMEDSALKTIGSFALILLMAIGFGTATAGDPYFSEMAAGSMMTKTKAVFAKKYGKKNSGAAVASRSSRIGGILTGLNRVEDCVIRSTIDGGDLAVLFLLDTNAASQSWAGDLPASAKTYLVAPTPEITILQTDKVSRSFRIGIIARDSVVARELLEVVDGIDYRKTIDSVYHAFLGLQNREPGGSAK